MHDQQDINTPAGYRQDGKTHPGGNSMSCKRCGGLMVIDTFRESAQRDLHRGIPTARCVNCGNWEDATILSNRLASNARQRPDRARSIPRRILPAGASCWGRMTTSDGPIGNPGHASTQHARGETAFHSNAKYVTTPARADTSTPYRPGRST